MSGPRSHTDALASLLRDPHDEVLVALPVERSCSICGAPIDAGVLAHVSVRVTDQGEPIGQACHRSCRAVADEAGWSTWWVTDTLVEYVGDLGGVDSFDNIVPEPILLDVVPDELHDEWRTVWAALRGEAPRG